MKILMMTNTYAPMVGGIEESIRSFTLGFEQLGHEVVIVAPDCEDAPPEEEGVIRLHAIQNFNKSDFSIALPMSSLLPELMKTFTPDIIHCHHPFWMGDIALRLSSQFRIPLVFTYHTMFEQHMHYLPVQNDTVKRFIIELFTGYANLVSQVIVPSESVQSMLLDRGVKAPMDVVPTGIDVARFSRGDGNVIRKRLGIPADAVVIGFVGRLALEKNIEFLCRSVVAYLKQKPKACFLAIGTGPLEDAIQVIFEEQGLAQRLYMAGVFKDQDLVDSYHAMNIFAFASLSETQGIVLLEAMAGGVPVVAVDAPGVREVVKDGYNGRLIFGDDPDLFFDAIDWCIKQPVSDFLQMKENARATAKEFADDLCVNKMLKIYHKVMRNEYVLADFKNSPWNSIRARFKNEWDMLYNVMHAGGASIVDTISLKTPVKRKGRGGLSNFSRWLSLSEWAVRFLHLSRGKGAEADPGLVLIQIDGLSASQLQKAFANRKTPFLRNLFQKKYYRLYAQYPGLPSSTPSVQGELFYGVKQIVPAFSFWDRDKDKLFRMYDSTAVLEIQRRLEQQGAGLLDGGSSYSNIYSGGAQESHFCATSLGWGTIWKDINPVNFFLLALTHLPSLIKMLALTLWEILLGVVKFGWGIVKGENFKKEFQFIYLRALICVLLRELVALGVKVDIARGLPIIHLNLLGYDELAHHYGPSSPSTHWSLRGIDRVIEKIYHKATRASHRNYDVWIYSDHGQEDTVSYSITHSRSVQEAVADVFKEFDAQAGVWPFDKNGEQLQRARFLGISLIEKIFGEDNLGQGDSVEKKLVVTAIGPTGNIYLPQTMDTAEKHRFAKALVDKAKIPVVLLAEDQGRVRAWTDDGEYTLPQDAKIIFGENHPFLVQVTEDVIRVCHHPNAGDFTIMGFRPGHPPMTFPIENGSHAGPGPEETRGFALLPSDIFLRQRDRLYLTPTDLRTAALRFLKRSEPQESVSYVQSRTLQSVPVNPETVRVMTYNVHSCVGMDGKISPERIARVIGRHEPDIVALQELDRGRLRTGAVDQPHLIAKELAMMYHYYPSMVINEQGYGNAVLSRYPMELIRAGRLPSSTRRFKPEPRGAIWAVINIAGTKVNVFNTHLGLFPQERMDHVKALLGSEWMAHPVCQGPVILCGDFNALPNSQLYRQIKGFLRDAQGALDKHNPKATWFGHYPVGRIDHVFIGPEIEVSRVEVSRTDLDRVASDHLPLIVDLKFILPSGNNIAFEKNKGMGDRYPKKSEEITMMRNSMERAKFIPSAPTLHSKK